MFRFALAFGLALFSTGLAPAQGKKKDITGPAPASAPLDVPTRPLHIGPYDVHGAGIDDTMPLRLSPRGPRRTP